MGVGPGIGIGTRALAGEAIQFTPGKSKVASDLETSLSKEKTSGPARRAGLGKMDIVEGVLVATPSAPQRSRREEKNAKNAEVEKKNWIILNRGELQQKDQDNTSLGLRDDSIEKEKTVGELWFTQNRDGKGSSAAGARANNSRGPATSRPTGEARNAPEQKPEEDTGPATAKDSPQTTADGDSRAPLAAPDQKEGSLKDLFRSTQLPSDTRRDDVGSRANSAASAAGVAGGLLAPAATSRSFGLNRDLTPGASGVGAAPSMDTSRRIIGPGLSGSSLPGSGPSLSGPSLGDGIGSGGRGFGGGLNAGSSFGSSFQAPFGGSPSTAGRNNQRPDFDPGSSRSTFDNTPRRY